MIKVDGKGNCEIDGIKYPGIGFGTYPLQGDTCFQSIIKAGEGGYRIIDTASFYENFIPIGNALKTLGRENFYIISKVWQNAQTPEAIKKDIEVTLKQLQTTYLDAYLLHWPNSKIPIEDTMHTMKNLIKDKRVRHIGLSNVNINHLKRVLELNIPISWVQVEMNPVFYDRELLSFCDENLIAIQAWAPLARGRINTDTLLASLGEKYGKSRAQIALRWTVQNKCVPLPGSKNEHHIKQNMDIYDFTLTPEDMEKINNIASKGKRTRITEETGLGFTDEFDFSYKECWPK